MPTQMKGNHLPKDAKKTIKRLFSYLKDGFKFKLSLVFVCIIISALTSVVASLFIKIVISDYIQPMLLNSSNDFGGLIKTILVMASIFGIGIVATYLSNLLMVKISQGILKKIRNQMFAKMQKLPVKYFDTHTHGDIMSHYTNDTDALEQMLSQSLPQMMSSIVTVVAVFFAMLYLSVYLTIIVILFLFIMFLITKTVGGKSKKFFIAQQQSIGKTTGFIEEMLGGQKVIKVFCHEKNAIKDFNKLNSELCENTTKANKYANVFMPIMVNVSILQYVALAIIGGLFAVNNMTNLSLMGLTLIDVGTIASFLQLSRAFSMQVSQMSQQINSVIMAIAGAERIFDLMDQEPEIDNGYVTLVNAKINSKNEIEETNERTGFWAWKHPHSDGTTTLTQLKGDVRFFDVDFGYNEDKVVLKNVSLYAKPGHKIAFVGATGAGKTTITNLINRFYELQNGKIRYDGININKIKKDDLRRSIGMVLQDTNLWTGTVKENIRYGALWATDEQVYEAAKLANADDFIGRLPKGYDTMLESDGANLSQGQRQLLSIARAAVANAPVMILDEATSSIDTRTEALIQKGMDALMHNRTVFVIAHRLSTVQNSNVIMVLEKGEIIEKGTHEDLIKQKGKYFGLYKGTYELE